MQRQLPGVLCASELLDWEAQAGSYLLIASSCAARQRLDNSGGD
ncbi:hypothetical protein [Stutzerimonas stutzeri]|nr:hypothetical protein [Stutzerimonas stutzeri]